MSVFSVKFPADLIILVIDINVDIVHYETQEKEAAPVNQLMSNQKLIELFHLIFLRHLGEKIDKNHFILKGGCNLRFFFKSIRYSQDIDLDINITSLFTLKKQVTKILESSSFRQILKTRKIEISTINPAKQTGTTQRWKLTLRSIGSSSLINTKIEFSRRGVNANHLFETVDEDLIANHKLYPVLCNHYDANSGYIQKISALIQRSETQARDIFDLDLLMKNGINPRVLPEKLRTETGKAINNAMSISFADYKAQVVAYLEPQYQEHFGSRNIWDQMQKKLINLLTDLQNDIA